MPWNIKGGDYERAAALYDEARAHFEKVADQADMVPLYGELGELASIQGDDTQAGAYYQAGLALAQALGDKRHCALLLDRLSRVACRRGDYAQATTLNEQSIDLYRALGNQGGLDEALRHCAAIAKARVAADGATNEDC